VDLFAPNADKPSVAKWEQRDALAAKVAFLSTAACYRLVGADIEARETHMSWVFLTPERVYKLKKPIRTAFLDFSTIRSRRHFCEEELRLNRRLAAQTYLGVMPLRQRSDGCYTLGREGRIVDWLVEMKRLQAEDMLDRRVEEGRIGEAEICAVAGRLVGFYRTLPGQRIDGRFYLRHLVEEQRINRTILQDGAFDLRASELVKRTDDALAAGLPEIEVRIAAGMIVEGHGDLRPEHVWLGQPLQIIDCLEFNRPMRLLDPFDEVNYLGMECEMLGAGWVRARLLEALTHGLGSPPSPGLMAACGAFRALLRARLSILHLLEKPVRKPWKWRPLALCYLEQAGRELAMSPAPRAR
jgi:uncharacterized protein